MKRYNVILLLLLLVSCSNTSEYLEKEKVLAEEKDIFKTMEAYRNAYEINCSCGQTFTMEILVDRCPHCNMTYGVTPCSQGDVNNIKAAGINY